MCWARRMAETLRIDRLGHRGDGVAEDGTFVPFTLPGERAEVERHGGRARLVTLKEASAARVLPACRHFGRCGGCALQHMRRDAYLDFKRGLVVTALAQRGLEAEVEPVRSVAAASRRRAVFALARSRLAYHARASHDLVGMEECPILVPAIETRLAVLGEIVGPLGRKRTSVAVLAAENGLDIAVWGGSLPGGAAVLERLARLSVEAGIVRLTLDGDILVQHEAPRLALGRAAVTPPPGSFVQAVAAAEETMATLAAEGLAGARIVADLFAGSGAFSLRLAETARVVAVESDKAALAALDAGWRGVPGLGPVRTLRRDLFRTPLRAEEMAKLDGVLFDPPRAGAMAQARELARAAVPRIVGVSCNPASFARDARILADGGYKLARVVPVDQFLHSPHIELVGFFER